MFRARILVLLVGLAGLAAPANATLSGAELSSAWRFEERGDACVLSRPLETFGSVRFAGIPGQPLVLQVLPRRDPFMAGDVTVAAVAPEWHAQFPSKQTRGTLHHVLGGGLSGQDPIATTLLGDLRRGFALKFWQPESTLGEGASAYVSGVRIAQAYEQFASCFEWQMPANFADVERSRIQFDSGGAVLTDEQLARIDLVAAYVLADKGMRRVFVDGHADASGAERDNMALSERRAKAVAGRLVEAGVPKEQVVVRFHAARYPAVSGNDPAALKQNRRATIRLERADVILSALH